MSFTSSSSRSHLEEWGKIIMICLCGFYIYISLLFCCYVISQQPGKWASSMPLKKELGALLVLPWIHCSSASVIYTKQKFSLMIPCIKHRCMGWRKSSVFKSTCFSSRRPRLYSQHLHGLQLQFWGIWALLASSDIECMMYTDTNEVSSWDTHSHKISKNWPGLLFSTIVKTKAKSLEYVIWEDVCHLKAGGRYTSVTW